MTLQDLDTIQKVKMYAVSRQKYHLASMLRTAEKQVRGMLNEEFTDELLDKIIKEIQDDQKENIL